MKKTLRLKDLGSFRTGLTYSPDNICNPGEGTLVLRSANIQNDRIDLKDCVFVNSPIPPSMNIRKGDILICSRNGSANLVGKSAVIDTDLKATWGAFMMLLRTKFNSQYVNYILNTAIANEKGRFATSTINQLTNSMLGGIQINMHINIEKQHRIVDYLDEKLAKIDSRIEVLEKQQDAYARLKKSIIHQAVTRGLNPNAPLKDSGIEWIGMIPEHWEVKRIKDLCSFISRGSTPDYVDESDFLVMNQAVFSTGCINHEIVRYSSYMKPESKIENGDLLIASTGGGILGKLYFFNSENEKFYADTHVTIVRSPQKTFYVKFLYYLLSIGYNMINLCMAKGSTNQTELQRDKLIAYEIAIPSIEEQTRIIDYLDEKCTKIDAAIENISKQIDASKRLKRALINEVITGQRAV